MQGDDINVKWKTHALNLRSEQRKLERLANKLRSSLRKRKHAQYLEIKRKQQKSKLGRMKCNDDQREQKRGNFHSKCLDRDKRLRKQLKI